ncbi:hypothetical protein GCM10023210_02450 [Chryseobacterium ginsengisoli]|uniref:Uncharacterized protein n=1 Tax=Chryseobacterium ginsengisoli TaxID=363853 RepID=A0ABP9LS16_9FLAO
MKFDLTYTELNRLQQFEYEIYEGDYDYIPSYLRVVEDAFCETEQVKFIFSSLQEDWNVFLFYDFLVFVMQLQDVFELCKGNTQEEYLLDFYAQGTERKLLLTKTDVETLKVENASGDKWISPVSSEYLNIAALQKDILQFVHKIKMMVEIVYPQLNTLEMLQKWYHSFEE